MVKKIISFTLSIGLLCLMLVYITNLVFLPIPTDYSKALKELSSTEPLELIDPTTGHLRYEGWGKYPNKWLYNPLMSKSWSLSRQFWNYYYIMSEDYLVTMSHGDLGTIRIGHINIKNLKNLTEPLIEIVVEGKLEKELFIDVKKELVEVDVEKNGNGLFSVVSSQDFNMTFYERPGSEKGSIEISAKSAQYTIQGSFSTTSAQEGISTVSQMADDKTKHVYTQKIQKTFLGNLTVNGETLLNCQNKGCLGLSDVGRGHFPFAMKYFWPSTMFRAGEDEVLVDLRFSRDNPNSSFDTVFINGKLYKLDPMVLVKETEDNWKWVKAEESNMHSNSLKLEFRREYHSFVGIKYPLDFLKHLVPFKVDFDVNYGYYSGEIKTNDGKTIEFNEVFGFAEEFHSLG